MAVTTTYPRANENWSFYIQVRSCEGETTIWTRDEDTDWEKLNVRLTVKSLHGSHLISYLNEEGPYNPDWVEIQSWQMVELDKERGILQWSRMVSNPREASDYDNRAFSQNGNATLTHISNTCPDR